MGNPFEDIVRWSAVDAEQLKVKYSRGARSWDGATLRYGGEQFYRMAA